MQTHDDAVRMAAKGEVSPHWLTHIMHEASKVGLPVSPQGVWSTPHDETHELLLRFSTMLCAHEHSPSSVLTWLSSFENSRIQERIAEHPNTPADILHRLAQSNHPDVRAAVAENAFAPFELLFSLSRDDNADVRYRLAENSALPSEILNILAEDENPYVAHRAQESIRKNITKRSHSADIASSRLSVLIVDDDDVTRLILALSLKSDPLINVVGQASSGELGVRMAIEQQPDIVLMDIGMPGMTGIEATREIKLMVPTTKVIMVTVHDTLEEIIRAFGHGAEGYHLKSTPNHDLGKAIRVVASGAYWLDPGIASLVLRELSKKSISILQTMMAPAEEQSTQLPNPVHGLLAQVDEYVRADQLTEARKICQAALSLSQSLYGENSASTNRVMSRLGELYFLEEQYSICESTYLELVKMQANLHELDDPSLDNYLSLLAEFYDFRWNHEQAELFYAWLLRVREKSGDQSKIEETRTRMEDAMRKSDKFKAFERRQLQAQRK